MHKTSGKSWRPAAAAPNFWPTEVDQEKITEVYLIAYSRWPSTGSECGDRLPHRARTDNQGKPLDSPMARRQGYEDLLWAIINTKEFLYNH